MATALKAQALEAAQQAGFRRASAGGAAANIPMLRVNTRLGYQLEPMWLTWERPTHS
ncbi:hypothetical protein ACFP81_08780 [Deinococcus lacus]|uniref:Uncharacterized protein n=1 Tax=Deinococcus lacus TaxID=392561 RepID=A0ABW1YFZ5_9DEIO